MEINKIICKVCGKECYCACGSSVGAKWLCPCGRYEEHFNKYADPHCWYLIDGKRMSPDKYDWWAWLRCKLGIHTPRVYWHPYHKAKLSNRNDSGKMYYWQCMHCKKIQDGGYLTDYYIDEKNYGEHNNPLSVKEIKEILNV